MKQRPGRNDPCSCGSGRKYKNCCEGKTRLFGPSGLGFRVWIVLGVAGAAVAAFAMLRADRPGPQDAASTSVPADQRPAPYTYDSLTNRHFDPVHGHWHDGPPPGSAGASAPGAPGPPSDPAPASPPAAPVPRTASPAPPATPEPYTYDAERNQHWDPNHQHWHEGLPPAGR